tara:strand:- start:8756 stop:9913 length:1158 start_codon:yes stop_codon:yes gene_type:complete
MMAAINVRKETSRLYIDFRLNGIRCREQTALRDTLNNRRLLNKLIDKMNAEIFLGIFDYSKTFPASRMARKFKNTKNSTCESRRFINFSKTWFNEMKPSWRESYTKTILYILESKLIKKFGDSFISDITKSDILNYRAELTTKGTKDTKRLSAHYINRILGLLSSILDEASTRYEFTNPCKSVKRLKSRKKSIQSFSLKEVEEIIKKAPAEYKDYLIIRFFTGLRTGELHALKWHSISFNERQIHINESIVNGVIGETKSASSDRIIHMSDAVFSSLKRLLTIRDESEFIFTRNGLPLTQSYITQSIWYPLIKTIGLRKRRPYTTRHTAATLWLASGENPEWIAKQLGHNSSQILFDTYSNYVPNLTRQDGCQANKLFNKIEVNL